MIRCYANTGLDNPSRNIDGHLIQSENKIKPVALAASYYFGNKLIFGLHICRVYWFLEVCFS